MWPLKVVPPDVEALVIDRLRTVLADPAVTVPPTVVGVAEPAPRPDGLFVVVRVDDLSPVQLQLFDAVVSVRVVGPKSDLLGRDTGRVARVLAAELAALSPPFAVTLSENGPYRVANTDTARPEWYLLVTVRVAGSVAR